MSDLMKMPGAQTCDTCGEAAVCWDCGNDQQCGPCYAGAVGHGGMPDCYTAGVNAVTEALGEFTEGMDAALSHYYGRGCGPSCEHGMH